MKKILLSLIFMGMVTMLPSCGEEGEQKRKNPLLSEWNTPYGVPPFNEIRVSDYMPAFMEAMKMHDDEIDAIVENSEIPDFENTILAYDNSGEMLRRTESVFWGIAAADTNPQLQEVQEKIGPALSEHYDRIILNDGLFDRVKSVYDNRGGLDDMQKRLTEKVYDDFLRAGAGLSSADKKEFMKINSRLAELSFAFGRNLLDENARFKMVIGDDETGGLTANIRNASRTAAREAGYGSNSYLFDLSAPSLWPFMTNSARRDLRQKMYEAYTGKCSNGDKLDNNEIVNEIVRLRTRRANLLGYPSHAAYVLADNMAATPENVYELLDGIWEPALKAAAADLEEMKGIMQNDENIEGGFEPWDWWYYSEKLRKQKYNLDMESVKAYLSIENVRQGIFELSNRLYGITFRPSVLPTYNNECVAYEVYDYDGTLLGILYMDLHPRPGHKGQGAWCGTFRNQSYKNGERVVPVVYIVANFPRPGAGSMPALLDIDDTKTFFHEFGHALHMLFSDVPYNGLLEVENDFVELPSQIMENWATEPEMLRSYAIHWQTGNVISEIMIDRISRSARFNQGFATTELVAASYLDMDIHNLGVHEGDIDLAAFTDSMLYAKRGMMPEIGPRYRYPYFAHIFDGGYSAGYYGYLWAEVLDKDAYQAFVETDDVFNKKVARRFREEILSKGGMADGMELYVNFRGRTPSRTPMLKAKGFKVEE